MSEEQPTYGFKLPSEIETVEVDHLPKWRITVVDRKGIHRGIPGTGKSMRC